MPPVPAPYLDGIASLPEKLLPKLIRCKELPPHSDRRVQRLIYEKLAPQIRAQRRQYERANGVAIERELPPNCFD